jgi:hypothetical protein
MGQVDPASSFCEASSVAMNNSQNFIRLGRFVGLNKHANGMYLNKSNDAAQKMLLRTSLRQLSITLIAGILLCNTKPCLLVSISDLLIYGSKNNNKEW